MKVFDPYPNNKPVVLFLHGLGTNSTSWTPQVSALADAGYRLIIPDIPGFGESPNLAKGWRLKNVSDALASHLDGLDIRSVVVVGLSMGGVIAQQFAIDRPNRVERLLLASTFPSLAPDNLSQAIYLGKRFVINYFRGKNRQAGLVADRIFPGADQKELRDTLEQQILAADPEAYRAATIELARFRLGTKLKDFGKPVLVIAGERDSTVSVDRQLSFKKYFPSCQTLVVQNAGHGVNIDQPEIFNQALLQFLN